MSCKLFVEELEPRLAPAGAPFALGNAPSIHASDFRITTFATGLDFPYGMLLLSDGSLVVGTSQTTGFVLAQSTGTLVRLVDTNHDGIADGPGTVLFTGLPGMVSAVRQAGNLFFVTSSQVGAECISVLRAGATAAAPWSLVGSVRFAFPSVPGGWEHTTYELAVRPTPGQAGAYDVFFNVGSTTNDGASTLQVPVTGLFSANLVPDSIYQVTVRDTGGVPAFSDLKQVAAGLRNAAGMAFQPGTGDFYFEDNGFEEPVGPPEGEEEVAADTLDRIPAAALGASLPNFGFPTSYIDFKTGQLVGSGRQPPAVAFLPDPITGAETGGAAKIAFAPRQFPLGLNAGVFVGFHGQFASGSTANDENPFVYADPLTGQYLRFIPGTQPGMGHLDGVVASDDSLFVADFSTSGGFDPGRGAIYQIRALHPVLEPLVNRTVDPGHLLTFTASAANPDRPADPLRFGLDPGAPLGAAIDPQTGVFSWTPTTAQAAGAYAITVRATNANAPELSDSVTFTATVRGFVRVGLSTSPTVAVPGQPVTLVVVVTPSTRYGSVTFLDGDSPLGTAILRDGQATLVTDSLAVGGHALVALYSGDDHYLAASSSASSVQVQRAALEPDPLFLGQYGLYVGGGPGDDSITISWNGAYEIGLLLRPQSGRVAGWRGSFRDPISRVVAYGGPGNDVIAVADNLSVPCWLYGGAGNDTLKGGRGNNLLLGGAGDDQLLGGRGRDLLMGGAGHDRLLSGPGDALLVGGVTNYDANELALLALAREWGRTDADYTTRTEHLNGRVSGGINGGFVLNAATVQDDGAADWLVGGSGLDLFFVSVGDRLLSIQRNEVVILI